MKWLDPVQKDSAVYNQCFRRYLQQSWNILPVFVVTAKAGNLICFLHSRGICYISLGILSITLIIAYLCNLVGGVFDINIMADVYGHMAHGYLLSLEITHCSIIRTNGHIKKSLQWCDLLTIHGMWLLQVYDQFSCIPIKRVGINRFALLFYNANGMIMMNALFKTDLRSQFYWNKS